MIYAKVCKTFYLGLIPSRTSKFKSIKMFRVIKNIKAFDDS